jgi:hypothetical protein
MVTITALWWADPDGGWVSSPSRFYRFGRPDHPDGVRRHLPSIPASPGDGNDDGSEDGG